jgi:hypothetical protein
VKLDEALAEVLGDTRSAGCDDRRAIYEYLNGKQRTASPRNVWNIGEALRKCGVAWCSGPAALYAAGHLADFAGVLGMMAAKGDEVTAARLLYGCGAGAGAWIGGDELLRGEPSSYMRFKRQETMQRRNQRPLLAMEPLLGAFFEEAIQRDVNRGIAIGRDELTKAAQAIDNHTVDVWKLGRPRVSVTRLPLGFRHAFTIAAQPSSVPLSRLREAVIYLVDRFWARESRNPRVQEVAANLRFATAAANIGEGREVTAINELSRRAAAVRDRKKQK